MSIAFECLCIYIKRAGTGAIYRYFCEPLVCVDVLEFESLCIEISLKVETQPLVWGSPVNFTVVQPPRVPVATTPRYFHHAHGIH